MDTVRNNKHKNDTHTYMHCSIQKHVTIIVNSLLVHSWWKNKIVFF